ncbi:MAG: hypothetical protein Q8R25_01310 [bacterium]|nr:hypothetical protein [bacterium]
MYHHSQFKGWIALATTVVFSAFVAYAYWVVDRQKYEYIQLVSSAQHTELQEISVTHMHTLMTNTKDDRMFLQTLLPTDVVVAVDAIDTAGEVAGVDVHISAAQPLNGGAVVDIAGTIAIAFTVQAEGSFAQLSRLVELLNSISVPPIYIEQLDFSRSESLWSLDARIRAFISSPTAS